MPCFIWQDTYDSYVYYLILPCFLGMLKIEVIKKALMSLQVKEIICIVNNISFPYLPHHYVSTF